MFWTAKRQKLPKSLVTDSTKLRCYTNNDITRTTISHKLWSHTNHNVTWTVTTHKLRGHTDLWHHELRRHMSVTKFLAIIFRMTKKSSCRYDGPWRHTNHQVTWICNIKNHNVTWTAAVLTSKTSQITKNSSWWQYGAWHNTNPDIKWSNDVKNWDIT